MMDSVAGSFKIIKLEDGTPKCRATGLWVSHPPVGCRTLRVRISFTDRWYPSGEQPPEIEYILVRYKGS